MSQDVKTPDMICHWCDRNITPTDVIVDGKEWLCSCLTCKRVFVIWR